MSRNIPACAQLFSNSLIIELVNHWCYNFR